PLAPALLTSRQLNRDYIERLGQVGVSRERVARLALDQNVDPLYPRDVNGQCLHQRIHGELLAENAGAMLVGEGSIQINDGRARSDQVDGADVGRRRQRMRSVRLL